MTSWKAKLTGVRIGDKVIIIKKTSPGVINLPLEYYGKEATVVNRHASAKDMSINIIVHLDKVGTMILLEGEYCKI